MLRFQDGVKLPFAAIRAFKVVVENQEGLETFPGDLLPRSYNESPQWVRSELGGHEEHLADRPLVQ